MKKSKKSMVHPSFPPQGTVQPSHMGSQSAAPTQQMAPMSPEQMGPQPPGNLPYDYTSNMASSGEY